MLQRYVSGQGFPSTQRPRIWSDLQSCHQGLHCENNSHHLGCSCWSLHHIDICNVFLNDNLNETIYMSQPPEFKDPWFPSHVCRLRNTLYNLKQAPHVRYQCLLDFLVHNEFTNDDRLVYILIYADDKDLEEVLREICRTFQSRDLSLVISSISWGWSKWPPQRIAPPSPKRNSH